MEPKEFLKALIKALEETGKDTISLSDLKRLYVEIGGQTNAQ